ncbi:hypothetical protein BJI46_12485 [Acinetobacter qingfengensis]|uniref:Uncharacterized protein n=2 Tax=Acinetobacter qingfengensis TaxID=1262585 RepID=A0A1E7RA44_9GAMM|nr:hypothetical protein BJI46_12485 [Acinetobacter qingfengensis]
MVEVNEELNTFRRRRNIADNAKTESIYNNAVKIHRDSEKKYRDKFYKSLVIVFSSTFLLFLLKSCIQNIWEVTDSEFWFLKLSVLTVGITLITYFIKQSSHYQHLADQNYQTQVELQAYPSFMESIPTEEAASVRKELALKYFGRELEKSSNKTNGNLLVDQVKTSADLVKATTEAIKNINKNGNAQ